MQAHYGHATFLGRSLDTAAGLAGLSCEETRLASLALPAARMARLHALNLRTWKDDAFARAVFDQDEIRALGAMLDAIATGRESASAVDCRIKQIVLRRMR
jgi:hypothetical protein